MRNIRGIGFAALLLLTPAAASAGIDKAGTTAAGFLAVGAGADVLGMGGATLGFGNGLGAASWNVASLGGLRGTEYVFAHSALTGASPQDWVAFGGRVGASMTRWGVTGLYQGDGTFEGRDASNNPTASFNASSMALGIQVAQPLGPLATVGLGTKYVSENLGGVTGGGMTFDAGLRMRAGMFGFGAAAQNVFGRMSYNGVLYDFPTNYGAGIAYSVPLTGLTFAVDANFPTAYYSDVRGGFEWRYRDRLALRTGYRKELGAEDGEPLGGPTFGMGAGANGFWVDYGFLTGGASGSGQHRVGLTYKPGFMNSGDDDVAVHAPKPVREAKAARAQPTYVDRAKAARALSPAAPKPAPEKTRAPEAVAPPATPAAAAQDVAPAKSSSTSTPDRAPSTPVPAPAPITSAPAKPQASPAAVKPEVPAKVEPAKVEPAKAEPAKVEPAKAEPAKVEPAKAEPAKVEPAKAEPAKVEPAKVEEPAKPAKVEEPAKPSKKEKEVAPAPPAARPDKVKVKSGQTLADIAKEWGNTVPALMMENNLVSEKVKPGQVLILPPKGR